MTHPRVKERLREEITALLEAVPSDPVSSIMDLLDGYEISKTGPWIGGLVMQIQQQAPQGFSRWAVEDAFASGLMRGRRGG